MPTQSAVHDKARAHTIATGAACIPARRSLQIMLRVLHAFAVYQSVNTKSECNYVFSATGLASGCDQHLFASGGTTEKSVFVASSGCERSAIVRALPPVFVGRRSDEANWVNCGAPALQHAPVHQNCQHMAENARSYCTSSCVELCVHWTVRTFNAVDQRNHDVS